MNGIPTEYLGVEVTGLVVPAVVNNSVPIAATASCVLKLCKAPLSIYGRTLIIRDVPICRECAGPLVSHETPRTLVRGLKASFLYARLDQPRRQLSVRRAYLSQV